MLRVLSAKMPFAPDLSWFICLVDSQVDGIHSRLSNPGFSPQVSATGIIALLENNHECEPSLRGIIWRTVWRLQGGKLWIIWYCFYHGPYDNINHAEMFLPYVPCHLVMFSWLCFHKPYVIWYVSMDHLVCSWQVFWNVEQETEETFFSNLCCEGWHGSWNIAKQSGSSWDLSKTSLGIQVEARLHMSL